MGKKGKLSAALGATAGGLAWTLAVLLLNRGLGWPDSWPTLVATGGLAFLASALVSKILRRPWAAHAGAVCALALLVACPLAGWPFQVGREKTVWREAEFIAHLLETEDNGPVENVGIFFQLPTVDNKLPTVRVAWGLYYMDNENNLRLEVAFRWKDGWEMEEVWENTHPERTKPPEILEHGVGTGVLAIVIDRIYPRETVILRVPVQVPEKEANRLTLRVPGENYSGAMFTPVRPENQGFDKKIRVWFVSRLWNPTENGFYLLEDYQRVIEYDGKPTVKLYPHLSPSFS